MPYLTELGAIDQSTAEQFSGEASKLADSIAKANPASRGVIVLMARGGVNRTTKTYKTEAEAQRAFRLFNNSGVFDDGLIFLRTVGDDKFITEVVGPVAHQTSTRLWVNAGPWILGGAAVIAAVMYYKRAAKRRVVA